MKSTHRISKIDKDIIILDDNSVYRADIMSGSKLMFWNAVIDRVEVESSGFGVSITNTNRNETIKASKISWLGLGLWSFSPDIYPVGWFRHSMPFRRHGLFPRLLRSASAVFHYFPCFYRACIPNSPLNGRWRRRESRGRTSRTWRPRGSLLYKF